MSQVWKKKKTATHLVHCGHHTVHDLIFEWLKYNRFIQYGECCKARVALQHALAHIDNVDDGYDVAVAAGAGAFHFVVQPSDQRVFDFWPKELGMEADLVR